MWWLRYIIIISDICRVPDKPCWTAWTDTNFTVLMEYSGIGVDIGNCCHLLEAKKEVGGIKQRSLPLNWPCSEYALINTVVSKLYLCVLSCLLVLCVCVCVHYTVFLCLAGTCISSGNSFELKTWKHTCFCTMHALTTHEPWCVNLYNYILMHIENYISVAINCYFQRFLEMKV